MSDATAASWEAPDLRSSVALVTGASRGVGRGIALALGDAGATVYVSARSTRRGAQTEGLPGTLEDTAEEIDRRGGTAVVCCCDHRLDPAVIDLFRRIRQERGRLDLLVNNAWSGYERYTDVKFDARFWEQPMWRWDQYAQSLRGQYLAARLASELMRPRQHGLIVNVGFRDRDVYLGQVAYDVCKMGSDRMVLGMAHELRKESIAAVALHPGFVRTERVEAAWAMLGEGPAEAVHSSEYVGRAIAHLMADPELMGLSGEALAVGDLARRYGFTDVDGRQPPAFRLEGRITLANRMARLGRIAASAREQAG
ncbi:MAG TPA: SDR family NAD(P)-dependent oxidoreductase [Solirubrobacteraceae bacterium]|nr:SDR family NAD(P)-dependent oxidoreductase [Solirubrobacteraceae bacterium]